MPPFTYNSFIIIDYSEKAHNEDLMDQAARQEIQPVVVRPQNR